LVRRTLAVLGFLCLGASTAAFAQLTPVHFGPATLYPNGSDATGIAVADLDLDGHLDLIVAAHVSGVVRVRPGLGDGTFGPEFDFPGTTAPEPSLRGLAVADFNGDGYPDIAVGNISDVDSTVAILLNDHLGVFGPTMFSLPTSFPVDDGPQAIVAGHFNNAGGTPDANLDLAVVSIGPTASMTILMGNGDGTFTEAPASPYGGFSNPSAIQAADLNHDTFLDLVVADSDVLWIFGGAGDGTFAFSEVVFAPAAIDVAIVDFNGDGNLDLVAHGADTGELRRFTGDGMFAFTPLTPLATSVSAASAIRAADFNRDGILDVAVLDIANDRAVIFTGDGIDLVEGDGFVTENLGSPVLFDVGDFNEDLKPDLAVGHAFSTNTAVLLNDTSITLSPPVLPGAAVGDFYSQTVTAINGTGPFTFTMLSGALPPGLSLTDDGHIGGVPYVAGIYAFTIGATDADGVTGSIAYSVAIVPGPTTTQPVDTSTSYSAAAQSVGLLATVSNAAGVNTGTVTFTVRDAGNVQIGSTVSGAVAEGISSVDFVLPPATPVQTLTVTAVYSGDENLTGSSGTASLVIEPATTAIAAANATASYSAASQVVPLSASVTSPNGAVYAGTVTFTVRNAASTQIGAPATSGTVSGGVATASYSLPGGTSVQTLTITAVYDGSANFSASSDATHTLTVGAASSTTAASNVTTTFSPSNQTVTLSAAVTSAAGTVNAGTVTFTVLNVGTQIGSPVSATVSGGSASAAFTIPGGTAAAPLTIRAVYGGSANFQGSSDSAHTLLIVPASTTTVPSGASGSFSPANQDAPLSAVVTSPAGTVNNGMVTFTVRTAGFVQVGSSVSANVTNGFAIALFTIPGGTATQTLTVTASYGASPTFGPSSGTAFITIRCPTMDISPSVAPSLRLGVPFTMTLTAAGVSDAVFSFTGSPPPGLTVSGARLSGTPTTLGQFSMTATATSAASGGCTGTRTYALSVLPGPVFVTGAGGSSPRVRTFDIAGSMQASFLADDASYAGGVRVAMGDVTGDGVDDIITAPGRDASTAVVRVIDGVTQTVVRQFEAYPYSSPGGTYVAAADINGDGRADIVTGRDGAPPEVKVFDGRTGAVLSDFFAYPEAVFGGVRVAAGDVDGDGFAEIITAPPAGAPPLVRVFGGTGGLRSSFMAYNPLFFGGVYVAAGDIDGDGRADIVTGADTGGGPHVMAFSGADLHVLRSFFAYSPFFTGGVRVAAGDVNGDGHAEIITAAGPGGGPHVRVWDGVTGAEVGGFFAFESTFADGVFVAAPPAQSRMEIGLPGPGATVPPTFNVSGWAAMAGATVDSGFDAIHAWLLPVTGGVPIFGGATTVGVSRPDVAALFGGNFANAGFNITVGGVPPGTYDLVVYPHSSISGTWGAPRVVRIVVTP
jgi:hypothetical protein